MATPQRSTDFYDEPPVQPIRLDAPRVGAPPPTGAPFGLTLGLVLALVVSAVLGAVTALDQHQELVMEREMVEARFEERLVEQGGELTAVDRHAELSSVLGGIRQNLERSTGLIHGLELLEPDGSRAAIAAPNGVFRPPPNSFVATIDVDCPSIWSRPGHLSAWQSGDALAADRGRLWRNWLADLLLTSLAVIVVVELSVHFLIGRPLRRLLAGLQRLEQGHLGPIDPGAGAWEIRWLAWRFEHLGRELAENARRLVAAERRALDATRWLVAAREPERRFIDGFAGEASRTIADSSSERTLARQCLEDTCRLLETLEPEDASAREIAKEAWTDAVVEAERLGDFTLKAQLEDAALRVLEHREFSELDAALSELRDERLPWSRWVGERLSEALLEAGVTVVGIQHRVKHTAGVWRKMKEIGIALEQVHDLFAFRIIVPSEQDCYRALTAVHRGFEPEPFRFKDYVESPKSNGYRSLHTTVSDADGRLFEVQIRTREMHESAENGRAAHWRYRAERWGSLASLRPRSPWYRRWFARQSRAVT